MLTLPLPILTFLLSAVACAMVWRIDLGNVRARGFFTAVFALMALGTLLIGLRFGYGVERFVLLQRIIPVFIGPLIYLGFLAMTRPAGNVVLHLSVAALAAAMPQLVPAVREVFDLMIGLSYLFYAVAILLLWRKGADAMTDVRLGLAQGLRTWMLVAAGMLLLMLVFDTIIAISFALRRTDDAVALISAGSVISMAALIAAIITFSRSESRPRIDRHPVQPAEVQLEQAARDLLTESRLYLDTGLTLDRLAKRLHVPARALSEAVNQTQGVNVSQYVNGFRLEHAAGLLRDTALPATQVMEQSGFLSRSNFYREFERVYGMSPLSYRKNVNPR